MFSSEDVSRRVASNRHTACATNAENYSNQEARIKADSVRRSYINISRTHLNKAVTDQLTTEVV